MSRRSLLLLAFLLATFSLGLFVTGGVVTTVLGVRVSARSPMASAIGAGAAVGLWLVLARRANAVGEDLARAEAWVSARQSAIILTVAGLAGAVAVYYGSFSANGSDASGYLSHALMLSRGQLAQHEPLAAVADWRDALTTLVPLGWRQLLEPEMQAPSYPVGLPLLMAPLHIVGGALAACLIAPISFALAVWAAGALAHRVGGAAAGLIAAVWLASSPIALVQAMQPMTDVPVTAAWLVCWLLITRDEITRKGSIRGLRGLRGLKWAFAGGTAAAIAVLIRPNLAPLAAIAALWVLLRPGQWDGGRDFSPAGAIGDPAGAIGRLRAIAVFSAPVALAGLLIAYLHWRWFGSPLTSGHGTAADFFAWAHVVPNVLVYTRWLLETHGPWLLVAPLAWFVPGGSILRWLLAFAAAVVVAYLIFGVFDVWMYLRFLLPALAIAMIAVAALIATIVGRLPLLARAPALAIVALALATTNVVAARSHGVFRFGGIESRAALTGRYLDAAFPAHAIGLAGEQSGSVRYYTGHSIVRWDVIDPAALDLAIARLSAEGHDVWVVLDAWEEEGFRRRFPNHPAGALDWPPRVEAGTEMLTRAWRLRDRETFLRGERVITDRLR